MDDNIGNLKEEFKTLKSRPSFEDRLEEQIKIIDSLNLPELKEFRARLKKWLDNVDIILKEDDIKKNDRKRKYFLGLRKLVIRPSLTYSKIRLKLINKVLNNGTNIHHAKRFVDIAAEVLPLEIFQKIYGLAIMNEENDKQTIPDIKIFVNQCKFEKNGNE